MQTPPPGQPGVLAPGMLPGEPVLVLDRPVAASWLRRVVAVLLDSLILSALASLVYGQGKPVAVIPFFGELSAPGGFGVGFPAVVFGAGSLMLLGQAYFGSTPGKRAVGISVIDSITSRPIGLASTLLRWIAHFLDAILMIGYLRPLWNRRNQTFADSLLGTVVVRGRPPFRHRWFGGRSRMPGQNGSGVTFGAILLCMTALVVHLGPSSYSSSSELLPVEFTAETSSEQTGFRVESLQVHRVEVDRRFWGVRHERVDDNYLDVEWLWNFADEAGARSGQVVASVRVDSADGRRSESRSQRLVDADYGVLVTDEDDPRFSLWGAEVDGLVELPPPEIVRVPGRVLDDLGPDWSLLTSLSLNGDVIATASS